MSEKTVLITGCSQGGLGAAMAKAYRTRGFRVFATVRDIAKAGSLGDIKGIEILELEVTSQESIRQCAKAVEKLTGGSLDILVNNAGIGTTMPLLDVSVDDAKKTYDVNVWAMIVMVQAFAPLLIKAKGTICNISSVSGELIFAWAGVYSSSRAATTSISETLRIELAPLGVRVITAILGGVDTAGNNAANKGELDLPVTSYYQKIRDIINHHYKGLQYTNKQNVDVAAKNIVNDVLSGSSYFIRRGQASTLSWFSNTFLPHVLFTSMINGKSGLAEVGAKQT
ncbi:putative short-chain dehydrogenases/reductase [Xylariaceae sp. AK1471]|nr:putative short-chain dehydrogenases/reductase [Xylariaceae sp. AK1471]